jgi:TP901 family phage tail tape measure protein
MAGSRIKGITIEIDGDTTKLTTALKAVDKRIRDTQGSLRDVNRLLKMDPGNADLLAQKQKYLTDAIDATKKKLEEEKTALEQLKAGPQNADTVRQQEALTREIEATKQSLKGLTDEYKNFGSVAGQQLQVTGQKMKDVGSKISGAGEKMLPATAAITGIGVASVKTASDFDAQMSRVQAISGATGSEFDELRQQAIDLGASSVFGATEAAQGMENMASAGFSVKEITAAMPGMLNLAASSGADLATSADIAASAVRGFGLEASETSHVADVLAQNAAATNASVEDTGEALKYVAPVANAAGLSLEEVTASIGIMSNAGIQGSQAGTTLRGALTRLMKPTKQVQDGLDAMGVSVYDSSGKMNSLDNIIGQIRTGTAGWTDEQKQATLAAVFGTNALSGMMALVNGAPDELSSMTQGLQNCDGAAQEMADTMMNNTKGSIEQMKGALETAAIQIGTAIAPVVTKVANTIGKIAEAFSSLPPGAQKVIIVIAAIVAAIGPVLIIIGKVISSVGTIVSAVGSFVGFMSATAIPAIGAVIPAIVPILPIIAAVVAAIIAVIAIVKNWGAISEWFKGVWEAVCNGVMAIGQGLADFFSGLWNGIKSVTETVWNGISTFFTTIWGGIKTAASTVFGGIKDFLGTTWEGIKGAAGTAWEGIKGGLSSAWNTIKTNAGTTFDTIKSNIGTAWENVKSNTSTAWGNIKNTIQQNGGGIRGVISTAMQGYKSIWQTGFNAINSITGGRLGNALSTVKSKMSGIKSAFSDAMNNAKSVVSGALDRIKGFFAGCHLQLPHIKLPHFSISGKLSLDPPSVPHLSVSWYRKAMDDAYILNRPTIFGMAGGKYLGGGEAGPEAVVGTDKLAEIVRTAVASVSGGTTVIPVYIGQERIDEIVVRAAQSQSFRSGGR